ncbi:hypothetical protein [Mechercharimyces sp. CAU 1602]|uniref:hypothetical protein n=1 Tax=Mechercharimyces sp. CAU 1602 TaxID=2973933 RepID=UPI002161C6A2|nr:hypothetical protein [Mechercharimyces sp. CAU 1602]MCS1352552.1 hypothetical protein [Mechercharimyces sp. CAU 1602]
MFERKLWAALIGSLLLFVLWVFLMVEYASIATIISTAVIFIYGVPISYLIDRKMKKVGRPIFYSFCWHLIASIPFIFLISIYAPIFTLGIWAFDCALVKWKFNRKEMSPLYEGSKSVWGYVNLPILLIVVTLTTYILFEIGVFDKKQHLRYTFSDESGWYYVVGSVPGAPPLEEKNGWGLINFQDKHWFLTCTSHKQLTLGGRLEYTLLLENGDKRELLFKFEQSPDEKSIQHHPTGNHAFLERGIQYEAFYYGTEAEYAATPFTGESDRKVFEQIKPLNSNVDACNQDGTSN